MNVPENKMKHFQLLFNGLDINFRIGSSLEQNNITNESNIIVCRLDTHDYNIRAGKTLEVLVKYKNEIIMKAYAGTLQKIKNFYKDVINNNSSLNITKIKINGL